MSSSQLTPYATEFMYPVVKLDSELSSTDSADNNLAIVEDMLDKLGYLDEINSTDNLWRIVEVANSPS